MHQHMCIYKSYNVRGLMQVKSSNTPSRITMSKQSQMQIGFCKFYEKWISELEEMLHRLLKALKKPVSHCDECELETLICRAKRVYAEYDIQKWTRVEDGMSNILDFYSPVWLSPLEKSRYWVTGWKPSAAFMLMDSLMGSKCKKGTKLDEGQVRKMRELRDIVQAEEEMVEREIEFTQTAVAERSMLELIELGGEEGEEVAVERLLNELEKVARAADCLRSRTVEGIMGILDVEQNVKFLAAAYMLQINMRKWGQRKVGNISGMA